LVHCSAGFNRSVTVCCAVLILLEGLSADAALARVREHHPWARPDSQHWLALRWLASGN
jgi:protein-tyrosine phosphatase